MSGCWNNRGESSGGGAVYTGVRLSDVRIENGEGGELLPPKAVALLEVRTTI
eukprot:COSAG04_NODE_454_length_14092_cov_330.378261_3_plen_52_part_00